MNKQLLVKFVKSLVSESSIDGEILDDEKIGDLVFLAALDVQNAIEGVDADFFSRMDTLSTGSTPVPSIALPSGFRKLLSVFVVDTNGNNRVVDVINLRHIYEVLYSTDVNFFDVLKVALHNNELIFPYNLVDLTFNIYYTYQIQDVVMEASFGGMPASAESCIISGAAYKVIRSEMQSGTVVENFRSEYDKNLRILLETIEQPVRTKPRHVRYTG